MNFRDAIVESPVGTVGRTGVKDAEAHVTDELRAEFKKIVKKLGGKTVAGQLLKGPAVSGDITEESFNESSLTSDDVNKYLKSVKDAKIIIQIDGAYENAEKIYREDGLIIISN